MSDTWNAKTYSQFLTLRTRPARDLLAAIPDSFQPKTVYDLGCGPGNSTILLNQRWPCAKIIGLDSSPNMLQEAKNTYPKLNFIEGDIASFSPVQRADCLFANASLQWLDQHEILIPKLLDKNFWKIFYAIR
jgi:trans-aconitate 2-methyltransferase